CRSCPTRAARWASSDRPPSWAPASAPACIRRASATPASWSARCLRRRRVSRTSCCRRHRRSPRSRRPGERRVGRWLVARRERVAVAISPFVKTYDQLILDLDGCVWIGDEAVPGSIEAITALREAGKRVAFATNNARHSMEDVVQKLWGLG